MIKQFKIENNTLTLKVNKSPLIVRIIMFIASTAFFIGPLIGLIIAGAFHIGFFIGFAVFGLLGFYMLRIALWNTHGEEKISFENDGIIYEANYGWFRDAQKKFESEKFELVSRPIGYVEDGKGVLSIVMEPNNLESVVKIPIDELEILIQMLEKAVNNGYN